MLFEKDDRVLFIGDSITDYDRARPVGEGHGGGLGTGYVADVAALLRCAYPGLALRVLNMGVSGNQVRHLKERWQADVLLQKPDWVCVMIGINDVWRQFDRPTQPETHVPPDEFEATYERLILDTLPHVKGMVLMSPFYIEPNPKDPMRAMMDQYGGRVRALAGRHGQRFVDMQAAFAPLLAHSYPASIAWDRVHPDQSGCMCLAMAFLNAIGFAWPA